MVKLVIRRALLILFGLFISIPMASATEKVTWNWAIYGPPRTVTVGFEHVAKFVKERSGGNFIINLRYNEQLSDAKDVLDGLKVGAFQGAMVAYSYAPAKTPLQGVLDMPFLPITNLIQLERVQDAFEQWKPVADELARWNAIHFMTVLLPQYEFMGAGKPPRTIEDWKGMRVRALGGHGDAMKTLGAIPTSVAAPEVYTALERGMFQAVAFPFAYAFTAYKLHEVSKWYTLGMHLGIIHNSINLSIDAWTALPAEYKKLLEDARAEAYVLQRSAYEDADRKSIPLFEKKKLEIITITPQIREELLARAGKPAWDQWVTNMERQGLPGKEAMELVMKLIKQHAGSGS